MSSYISYIGPYIKFPVFNEKNDKDFLENNKSKNYSELGYISQQCRYLISSNKPSVSIDEVDNIMEKEITVEERTSVIEKFTKDTENFTKNFKQSFDVDLEVKYGVIFYEP